MNDLRPPAPRRRAARRRPAACPAARLATALLLGALLLPAAARAEIQITLQNSFIEKYKNRATLDATFTVDKAHRRPNPPAKDGDLHAAGRAPEIGLASVAEVMNAAAQPEALDLIHQAEGGGQPLAVRGVWRLWCEHGGDSQHVQGESLQPFTTTNPPHVFELHPLLRVADQDLAGSFRPIDGFTYKDASQAFHAYEQLSSHITTGDGTTTITTRMAGFNYVELVIRLDEEPIHVLPDGLTVKAAILDTGGELLVSERRMVAVAGTVPYTRVKALHKGDALHVVGVPRIDLSLVAWRVANASRVAGVLDWSLPYEIVLVAAFDDHPSGPDLAPSSPAGDGASPGAGPVQPPPARHDTAAPVESVTPSIPGGPAGAPEGADGAEADVVATLLRLLGQALPPEGPRGACTFSSGERSYCASISGPQCDQLGGAFNAGEACPSPNPIAAPPPAGPAPPQARPPQPSQESQPQQSSGEPPPGTRPVQAESPESQPPPAAEPQPPPAAESQPPPAAEPQPPPSEPQPPPPAAARTSGIGA
jgi:hypothetical protein